MVFGPNGEPLPLSKPPAIDVRPVVEVRVPVRAWPELTPPPPRTPLVQVNHPPTGQTLVLMLSQEALFLEVVDGPGLVGHAPECYTLRLDELIGAWMADVGMGDPANVEPPAADAPPIDLPAIELPASDPPAADAEAGA